MTIVCCWLSKWLIILYVRHFFHYDGCSPPVLYSCTVSLIHGVPRSWISSMLAQGVVWQGCQDSSFALLEARNPWRQFLDGAEFFVMYVNPWSFLLKMLIAQSRSFSLRLRYVLHARSGCRMARLAHLIHGSPRCWTCSTLAQGAVWQGCHD